VNALTGAIMAFQAGSSVMSEERHTMNGTIKRLVSDKGFGFILSEDGNEYFFHQSACNGMRFDDLREGQAVTFTKGQGPKGPRAEDVRLA
jgi:CspA family cold shock protein